MNELFLWLTGWMYFEYKLTTKCFLIIKFESNFNDYLSCLKEIILEKIQWVQDLSVKISNRCAWWLYGRRNSTGQFVTPLSLKVRSKTYTFSETIHQEESIWTCVRIFFSILYILQTRREWHHNYIKTW